MTTFKATLDLGLAYEPGVVHDRLGKRLVSCENWQLPEVASRAYWGP